MNFQEDCARALAGVGSVFGIDGLVFDAATGTCALAFDHRVTVHLAIEKKLQGLVLFSVLGDIDPLQRPDLMAALLRGNYMWRVTEGATLSLDPQRDTALLAQTLQRHELSCEILEARLTVFVNTALAWWDRLRTAPAHVTGASPQAPVPTRL